MKIEEVGEFLREGAIEDVVGEVEKTERGERGERRGYWAGEFVVGEGEIGEEREVGEGESAGEGEGGEVERNDVAVLGTFDTVPGTVRGFWVP